MVLRDVETGEVYSCTDEGDPAVYHSIADGLVVLSKAETIYGHNILGFDDPALQKLYPDTYRITGKLFDTFIVAGMRWCHIKEIDYANMAKDKFPRNPGLVGSHSLEAWGCRLGIFKGKYETWCREQGFEPWAQWRPEMQTYCEQDTDVTLALVKHIRKYGVPKEAVETEQELRLYLLKQEANGWPFQMEKAAELQGILAAKRDTITQQLKECFGSWTVDLGLVTPKVGNKKLGRVQGVPYMKQKTVEFNPGSRQHIANRLTEMYGWKPKVFTDNGQAQVNEATLRGLKYEPIPLLREYLLLEKRIGQLSEGKEGWLRYATKDGPEGGKLTGLFHIHGRVLQGRTITHRAAHSKPNIAQVPRVGSPYGEECRSLFYVPAGWVEVGADASSLEARCLGHYLARFDGGEYGKLLLESDVHAFNMVALGLSSAGAPVVREIRDVAKRWLYAYMYGAGETKLGHILSTKPISDTKAKQLGKAKKELFLKNTPAFAALVKAVQKAAREKGFLKLIDGRRAYIRSEHAALNTLLQGTGAVICKAWIVECGKRLTVRFGEQGWTGQWAAVGWIHDENQTATRTEIAEEVKPILVDSIRCLTERFKFRVALDGEAKQGRHWADCH